VPMSRSIQLPKARLSVLFLIIFGGIRAEGAAASASYTYDQTGRITTALYDTGVCIAYTYDAAGNRAAQVSTVSTAPESPTWGAGTWGCFPWTPH
jgi:YD repeat-containing protein